MTASVKSLALDDVFYASLLPLGAVVNDETDFWVLIDHETRLRYGDKHIGLLKAWCVMVTFSIHEVAPEQVVIETAVGIRICDTGEICIQIIAARKPGVLVTEAKRLV